VILHQVLSLWRLADGTPAGKPLEAHRDLLDVGGVGAVAAGTLPDGTRSSSAAVLATTRCGCGGWPTVPRSYLRWTCPNRYRLSPFTSSSSSLRPGPTSPSTSQRSHGP